MLINMLLLLFINSPTYVHMLTVCIIDQVSLARYLPACLSKYHNSNKKTKRQVVFSYVEQQFLCIKISLFCVFLCIKIESRREESVLESGTYDCWVFINFNNKKKSRYCPKQASLTTLMLLSHLNNHYPVCDRVGLKQSCFEAIIIIVSNIKPNTTRNNKQMVRLLSNK